jgi:aquaporin Z
MNTKQFAAELIGTFVLVFIGAGAGALAAGGVVGVALAHGFALLVVVYAYGHISGAHINPAVTFGLGLAGAIDWVKAAGYWLAQFLGGILAAAALSFVLGGSDGLETTTLAEGISHFRSGDRSHSAFFLVNTVLHAAVAGKAGQFAGLAIGLTLAFSILMGDR